MGGPHRCALDEGHDGEHCAIQPCDVMWPHEEEAERMARLQRTNRIHRNARRILELARRHSEGEVYRGYRSWVISGDHQKPGDWAGFMRLVCGKTHPDEPQPAWYIEWFTMRSGHVEDGEDEHYLWIARHTARIILRGLLAEEEVDA